jgi:hypothetical protein
MPSDIVKGRYSMRVLGYTINTVDIPGANTIEPTSGAPFPAPVKILEPITALGVVGYDGNGYKRPEGGKIAGSLILRRTTRASVVPTGVVRYDGTSALVGAPGTAASPLPLKSVEVLPISRYWIEPHTLTGRAVMFAKHGTGKLDASDVSVLDLYFVLEERKKANLALKIAFLTTDTRFFAKPFAPGADWTVQPPTPFIEWGVQTRIDDEFDVGADPTGGDPALQELMLDFATQLGVQVQ